MVFSRRYSATAPVVVALAWAGLAHATREDRAQPPVAASVESTLATASAHIRQLAFDGDASTFFESEKNAGASDHFTLVFDNPVVIDRIIALSGRPDGSDKLEAGILEASADGKTFRDRAHFCDGTALAVPGIQPVRAVRIKPSADLKHPLVIREIAIESKPAIAVFQYPVEILVDVGGDPEMKSWAEKIARVCERAYPMINEELKSDGFTPPRRITMTLKKSYRGVAAASGDRIVGSLSYFKQHRDDVGAMIHETTHVVQHYRGAHNPGWLVEGISDYVRFFKFEPGKIGKINAERAHYNGSYRVTAAFLAFVAGKYDKVLVTKLNKRMREGHYKDEAFHDLTGKSLHELDEEWRAALKR
jgi:Peptidase of plants and bacteria